jgi:hypothetical protein
LPPSNKDVEKQVIDVVPTEVVDVKKDPKANLTKEQIRVILDQMSKESLEKKRKDKGI